MITKSLQISNWLVVSFLICTQVYAAEIVLEIPDEVLKQHIQDRCTWDHCERNAPKSDAEKAQWVIDRYIQPVTDKLLLLWSAGKVGTIEQVNGKILIRYHADEMELTDWLTSCGKKKILELEGTP